MAMVEEIEKYAKENNIPIMQKDGINYLVNFIKTHNIKNVLEIGTAIGYSAIMMCMASEDVKVTSIERDNERYLEAVSNVNKSHLDDRISLIFGDALDLKLDGTYDLIFIDAAKAQNIKFFEKYKFNLKDDGYIITDNMNFHGLVKKPLEEIKSKNVRGIVKKIIEYKEFLVTNDSFDTEFLEIGDGIAVSHKEDV